MILRTTSFIRYLDHDSKFANLLSLSNNNIYLNISLLECKVFFYVLMICTWNRVLIHQVA
jgi:hypothetical protein